MNEFLLVLAFIVALFGIIGSIVPAVPGPVLSFLSLWIAKSSGYCDISMQMMAILLVVTVLVIISDYILPQIVINKIGGTKYGIWGATIGMLLGFFLTPIGMFVGMLLGSFVGEYFFAENSSLSVSLKSTLASSLGFLLGMGIKLIFSIYIVLQLFSLSNYEFSYFKNFITW